MTFRLVRILVNRLPPESATKSRMRDDLPEDSPAVAPRIGYGAWSHSDMLLAAVYDVCARVEYAVYAAQGGKPRRPDPYPRPGVKRKAAPDEGGTVVALNESGFEALKRLRGRDG